MKRHVGVILILATLLTFACTLVSNILDQDVVDQDVVDQQVVDPQDTITQTAPEATAVTPTDDPAQPPTSPETSDFDGLTSYRSRTVVTDLETDARDEVISEATLDPFALRMEMEMGEMIMTQTGVWMEMAGIGWIKMDFTAEELAMSREEFMALEWGGELEELPDIPPWPSQLLFMPDQASLSLMEGGLTPAGRDNINGIACQKYNIVTNYSYEIDDPVFGGYSQEDMEATGSICVADQADLPALVIWADIDQTSTRIMGGQTVVWQHRVEYEITAVNIPLVIEPPADALSFEDMYGDWDDDDFDYDYYDADPLAELDSYRLVIAIHIQMEGYETTSTTTFEWVNEPRAYRHLEEQEGLDFDMEWIAVGDQAWMRMGSSGWMPIEMDEEPTFGATAQWYEDENAQLVGTTVVNGINCRHYRHEPITAFGSTVEAESWVANEPGLPVMVIRSVMHTRQEGQVTTTEVNLHDINQPITIEPPE